MYGSKKSWLLGFVVVFAALQNLVMAENAPSPDARLRDALRETTLQLRTAQSDLATAQASQAQLAADKKLVDEKYEALRKKVLAEQALSDKSLTELRAQVAEQKAAISRLHQALEKTRSDLETQTVATKDAEAAGEQLKEKNAILARRVADREQKNLTLFLLGNEILARYEDFGLGKAIQAKEPFVGRARVRLENLVQDYEDQLADQRAKP
ncbi:MAG TPA: phage major capsid protein [Opitutaceae bacterium]